MSIGSDFFNIAAIIIIILTSVIYIHFHVVHNNSGKWIKNQVSFLYCLLFGMFRLVLVSLKVLFIS